MAADGTALMFVSEAMQRDKDSSGWIFGLIGRFCIVFFWFGSPQDVVLAAVRQDGTALRASACWKICRQHGSCLAWAGLAAEHLAVDKEVAAGPARCVGQICCIRKMQTVDLSIACFACLEDHRRHHVDYVLRGDETGPGKNILDLGVMV